MKKLNNRIVKTKNKKMAKICKNKTIILFLIIIALAVFFRFWQINNIPPGVYPDEAMNGNDSLISLQNHNFKVFYPENNGREGLFMWLISLSFLIFKPSIFAFRVVPAFFGVLTVIGLYFLSEELFCSYDKSKRRAIALLSSFFLAISFWHINFSRIDFRAILVPFFIVFGSYFLFRGFRLKKYYLFIISGFFLGLGFYTYIAYRLAVLLFIVALFGWWLIYKKDKELKQFFLFTIYLLISIFIFALPIGIYFFQNPAQFFGRAAGVSILSHGNPFYNFLKSFFLHLGMFNFHGDGNWRHNFSGQPELFWPVGILFLLGFFFSIKKLFFSIRNKNYHSFLLHSFLISWFFILLLPGALSYEGIPHSLRVIGVIPVVYIFVGFSSFLIYQRIKVIFKTKKQKIFFYFCLFVFLLSTAFAQFDKYFYQWAERPEVKGAFTKNYVKIGKFLNSLPDNVSKYVLVNEGGVPVPYPNGIPMPAQTTMFIERLKFGHLRANYLLPSDINKIKIQNNEKAVIIPLQPNLNIFLQLKEELRRGEINNERGVTFYKI